MNVTLNSVQVQSLSSVVGALADGSPLADAASASIFGGANVNVSGAAIDMDALLAQLLMETNDARLEAAQSRLSSVLMQLTGLSEFHKAKVEEMKVAGQELISAEETRDADRADFEKKNSAFEEKKAELEQLQGDLNLDDGMLEAAQCDYDSAKAARDTAMKRYEASESVVNEKRSRFDSLIDSLDMVSRAALGEAFRLDASDIGHLREEIDEDDKKHSLATVRSVEDVIGESLKRLDDEIVDEVDDRHLDHV